MLNDDSAGRNRMEKAKMLQGAPTIVMTLFIVDVLIVDRDM